MEPVFVNRFVGTKRMCRDYVYKALMHRAYRWSYGIIPVGVAAILLSLGLGVETFWDRLMVIVAAAAVAVLFLGCVVLPRLLVRLYMWNGKAGNGGKAQETVIEFGDRIHIVEGRVTVDVEYSEIVRIVCAEFCCALMLGRSSAVLIDPDGFVRGDFQGFRAFIEERCENVAAIEER